jgi:hypothetical protein
VPGYLFGWELWKPLVTEDLGGLAVQAWNAIPLLMETLGHQAQRQTMAYLGIQVMEVAQIFEMEL